jgi:UDPglucose 6-dehydrogenase
VGATVRAFDPAVEPGSTDPRLAGIEIVADAYAAVAGADVLAVLTEWPEFREADFARVAAELGARNVVDARNLLDAAALKAQGFSYDGIGRS